MNNFKKLFFLTLSFLAIALTGSAQSGSDVEMADLLRTNGKIYVVVAVLTIVFIGIAFFLMRIDRRVSKLEKDLNVKKD